MRVSKKVCGIKSATNVPGAIPFIGLGFCGVEHVTENRLSCSEGSSNADLIKTLLSYRSELLWNSFRLKLLSASFYIIYTLQIGHKAVYERYIYAIETIKI